MQHQSIESEQNTQYHIDTSFAMDTAERMICKLSEKVYIHRECRTDTIFESPNPRERVFSKEQLASTGPLQPDPRQVAKQKNE